MFLTQINYKFKYAGNTFKAAAYFLGQKIYFCLLNSALSVDEIHFYSIRKKIMFPHYVHFSIFNKFKQYSLKTLKYK